MAKLREGSVIVKTTGEELIATEDDVQDKVNEHEDKSAPHSGHATTTALNSHVTAQASLSELGHIYHAILTTTLDTNWTGSSPPYIKTQTVSGILATDVPIVDVVLSGDWGVDEARLEAWGYIYRIVTSNNSVTVYASEKPDVALPIQLKVVR